mmetsp:Transcript_46537/g.69267  ORF Transcript_46537/g.69267 Transcript_46537/m.69267 type:complete len:87 (+) Transcript_46537:95-355(+)
MLLKSARKATLVTFLTGLCGWYLAATDATFVVNQVISGTFVIQREGGCTETRDFEVAMGVEETLSFFRKYKTLQRRIQVSNGHHLQ